MGTTDSTPRFYVYVLARPNGKPFYVGKGRGKRVFEHDSEARNGCDCHKCRVIRKIWRNGGSIQRYIMFETDDEQEAFAYEIELIAMYGQRTLANKTNGGDGMSGSTPEQRAAHSKRMKEWMADPENRRRFTERMQQAKRSPEYIEHQRTIAVERWSDPELRRRKSETTKRQFADPERRAKAAAATRALWQDPEYRAKTMAARKKKLEDPEIRAQMSATRKRLWQDPEARAKMTAIIRANGQKRRAGKRLEDEDGEH